MKAKQIPLVILPLWIPLDAWRGFILMRNKIHAPLTERGKMLVIRVLTKLLEAGNDPEAVLDQSTMHSWRGLFPVKDNGSGKAECDPPAF